MLKASLRRDRGFTMIEVMIVVTLIAITIGISAPYAREAIMNVRMTGNANDLMASLALARSEAVRRNLSVYLCTTTDGRTCGGTGWAGGWLVFADLNRNAAQDASDVGEEPLRWWPALEGNNTVQVCGDVGSGPRYLPYHASGLSTTGGAAFTICDSRTEGATGRTIRIGPTGRATVTRVTCPQAAPSCS